MPNLGKLQQQVYSVLRDSEQQFVLPEEVEDWINEAQIDIVARLRINKATATGTTSATGTVTLPTDWIASQNFYTDSDLADVSEWPEFTDDDVFLSFKLNALTPPRTIARVFNGVIETYPAIESKAYTLEYSKAPTTLVDPGDVPVIPQELHVKLVHYARAHAKWKEGEQTEGETYWLLYNEGLPGVSTTLDRERPKSVGLLPEATYWDQESWDWES